MLVDCPVDVTPDAVDLHVRLVDKPPVSRTVAAEPSSVGQQRCETLHPAVDGYVVDFDAAFGEQLLNVTAGKPVA